MPLRLRDEIAYVFRPIVLFDDLAAQRPIGKALCFPLDLLGFEIDGSAFDLLHYSVHMVEEILNGSIVCLDLHEIVSPGFFLDAAILCRGNDF